MVIGAVVAIGSTQTSGAASGPANGQNGSARAASSAKATVPGAPTKVTAGAGPASATISWTAPVHNGGASVTGYLVAPSSGSSVRVGDVTGTVVTGLHSGRSYTFTVAAINRVGIGPTSGRSDAVTPTPPAAPTTTTAAPTTTTTTPPPPTTTTPPPPAASAVLLPLYDASGADWQRACTTLAGTASFVIADIGNPGGPGTAESPSWAGNIGDCGASGVGVMGYVDTGYCQVPLATAEGQIDSWYGWYRADGLRGIFFDEASDPSVPGASSDCLSGSSSALAYYRALSAYVHDEAAGQTVALNFGVNPGSDWPFASSTTAQNADIAVVFEDPYTDLVDYGGSGAAWSPASWEAGYGSQRFAVLAYDASGANQPAASCSVASRDNIGYAFVTPTAGYVSLPTAQYLAGELADC